MSRFERQDELNHPRNEVPEFTQLVEKGLSRRRFLGGAAALGAAAFFTVSPLSRAVAAATKASPLMGFAPFRPAPKTPLPYRQATRWSVWYPGAIPVWHRARVQ
ncbi:twin-arginine translocation signal domain-containing protein [Oceanimonas sp. NS1]|nr:twin-arginine translocation signal domain-containing protein [Oceanimonas sp. NS1]